MLDSSCDFVLRCFYVGEVWMPSRPLTRCPSCRRRHPGKGRCSSCDARRGRDIDSAQWERIARIAVERHLNEHGPVCPGYMRDAHVVRPQDLTADHRIARHFGGTNEASNVVVLCRPCNSRKGAR